MSQKKDPTKVKHANMGTFKTYTLKEVVKNKLVMIIAGILVTGTTLALVFIALDQNDRPQLIVNFRPRKFADVFKKLPFIRQAFDLLFVGEGDIKKQQTVDIEYGNWQHDVRLNYPWLDKLPLLSTNYFVYFDLTEQVFVGKLYLKSPDTADELKITIMNRLAKDAIPYDEFGFSWIVLSK